LSCWFRSKVKVSEVLVGLAAIIGLVVYT